MSRFVWKVSVSIAGASLFALAVYYTARGIQNGDWIGTVTGAAVVLGIPALAVVALQRPQRSTTIIGDEKAIAALGRAFDTVAEAISSAPAPALAPAKAIVDDVPELRAVATPELAAPPAVAAIDMVKSAVAQYGSDVETVVLRWVAPILDKIATVEGPPAATRVAQRLFPELAVWGETLTAATSSREFQTAASALARQLARVLRIGRSAPISTEVGQLEAQFAADAYQTVYVSKLSN